MKETMHYKTMEKNKRKKIELTNDVIHGIQEDGCGISWIHDNTINGDVPIFIQRVMFIDVPPPSQQTMVILPHVEHLAKKVSKVRIILEHGVEFLIGLLP